MKKLLPFETRKSIYLAIILPHFNYCSETWHFCSKSANAKLEKEKIGLPSFTNQRFAKIVCMVYKAINHDHAPKSIKKLLDFRNTTYDLKGTDILKLLKVNTTTYGLKSWCYLAPKLWNSL